ncbi:MAG: TonB-dependent receptor [Bacteroidetes bacterium]|nr:TonB-dependent receptor [Bacteroidota bacterium]
MKKIIYHCLFIFLIVLPFFLNAQQKSIEGFVSDRETGNPLAAANVVIKGTQQGATTNDAGFFKLQVEGTESITLLVTYVGYKDVAVNVKPGQKDLRIQLEPTYIMGTEVVVSASRISENIRKAPLTIQKISERQIQSSPSGDYFQDLGSLRDVEVINNSIGFKIFNTRGFNTSAQLRVVQLIDEVDNQLPTINIVPGNMFGVSDIDIRNIEVISGPASALYGPNAMQGVLSYQTKDPYDYPGVAVQVKGGNREFFEGQFRAAKTFFKNKLGLKITGSYMRAMDWQSDYIYGQAPANPSLQQKIMGGIMNDPSYADFKNYFTNIDLNTSPFNKVMMPGYTEEELFNGQIDNMKVSGAIYYRFLKDMQVKYVYRFSTGTSLFMGNNRAPLEDFYHRIHLVEFKGKGFTIRGYNIDDNTKDTYTLVGAGMNLGFASLGKVDAAFLPAYVNAVQNFSNNFSLALTQDQLNQAIKAGTAAAANSWLKPGTEDFEQAYEKIQKENPPFGAHYSSKTSIYHVDGMYEYASDKIDWNIGASFRNTHPISNGTVFADTLQKDGTYREINVNEYGGFIQGIGKFSDDMVKLYASIRLDKSENYDWQFSPRIALVTSIENHNLRITAQSAFRAPAVSDQYQLLNRGSDIVVGNVDGFGPTYSQNSINAYQIGGYSDSTLLEALIVPGVKPEQVKTVEFGYNGTFFNKLYVDFSAYYSRYSDFIAYTRTGTPRVGVVGEQSGIDAIKQGNYQKYNVATNIEKDVDTYGAGISLGYYFLENIMAYINYTYSNIDSSGLSKDVIPGFNTPKHKFNVGVQGKNVYKNFGFTLNFKWVDSYYWEAIFASGPVPSYNTLDAQISYGFPKIYSTLRLGGSNILGEKYIQAYAMPEIGAFYYVSWSFDFGFKK